MVKEYACSAGDPGLISGSRRSPGKGVTTHTSILAWRIRWTEEPGGLQSMGSYRVRHDWATNTQQQNSNWLSLHTLLKVMKLWLDKFQGIIRMERLSL